MKNMDDTPMQICQQPLSLGCFYLEPCAGSKEGDGSVLEISATNVACFGSKKLLQ